MDPRRARDPRLARADPRLQNRHSNSPAPAQTPTPTPQATPVVAQSYQQTPQNNLPASYASVYPPGAQSGAEAVPGLAVPGPSTVSSYTQASQAVQSVQQAQPTVAQTQQSSQQVTQPPTLKTKPKMLFCVVCASNQVRELGVAFLRQAYRSPKNRSMEAHNALAYVSRRRLEIT